MAELWTSSVWPPFWRSSLMDRESVMFLRPNAAGAADARLLFCADEIKDLRLADGNTQFEQGRDYVLESDCRTLRLTASSRIPWQDESSLFVPGGSPHGIGHKQGEPDVNVLWGEGSFFHDRQVQVTYSHSEAWTGTLPCGASPLLPATRRKICERQPLRVALGGDSISAGYNASGTVWAHPYMPAYPALIATALEDVSGCPVLLVNRAVGGWNSGHGLDDLPALIATEPDLVILAFGMNDVGGTPPEVFQHRMSTIIAQAQAARPEVEIVLVATMLGNPLWVHTPPDRFPVFRDILASMTAPGVALADLTQLWTDILRRKRYVDLSGNGVNHPNDFGHRLYAQVLLDLLIGDPATARSELPYVSITCQTQTSCPVLR